MSTTTSPTARTGEVDPQESAQPRSDASGAPRFPWRATLIGLLLSPPCIFWIDYTEIVARGADLVAMSLIISVVAILLVVIAFNLLLRRIAPKWALTQAELLLIYAINSTSAGIGGLGMYQFLVNQSAGPSYFASKLNHWENWLHLLRTWAYGQMSADVVGDYYRGHTTLFTAEHLLGWAGPVAVWTSFTFVLLFAMYCIGTLLRKQWVERERLLFPIVTIPVEITQNGGASPLWRTPLFWMGATLACLIESLATLHYSFSSVVPYLPVKPNEPLFDLSHYVTAPPWSAAAPLWLAAYPLVIGLAFLLALDVSFSVWFFYLFSKFENIITSALGFKDPGAPPALSRTPYFTEQCAGAFTALAVVSLYYAWPHLKEAWQYAFHRGEPQVKGVDDAHEPLSYRTAYVGLFVSAALLIAFGVALGIPLVIAALFFVLFFLWAIAFSRIRAEAGLPWGTGPGCYVRGALVDMGGSSNYSTETLAGLQTLRWFDSDYRTMAMPSQLEAMKLAEASADPKGRIHPRHMTAGIFAAIVVASLASWVSILSIYYHFGAASASVDPWRSAQGHYGFEQLQGWINNPKPLSGPALAWASGGFVTTIILSVLRTRFVWWPLHPIGYVVSNTGLDWIWFPIFAGWLVKRLILRYGGMKSYRSALPFFLGLVIGDFAISAALAILTAVIGVTGYRTFPI